MSQVQQIKDAVDIVEIIGERIELRRSGRNWRGLCPFHSEKTPSFFVSEELQRYKCFGCGETGDVYNFLEKYEGMTFSEALQYLADLAGVTLKKYKPSPADEQRNQHLEILSLAREYYHYLLTEHKAGQKARTYLKNRGTNQDSIKLFQLGYSLPAWDGLIKYLHHKKKYKLELLVETGLVIKRKGRHYDRFRDRVMFPLKNHRGQVVGFSGRSLELDVKQAKYINSPETKLYHKAELLYGYSELLQFIRKKDEVIVTEGEFDVISSTQAHVNNIVAIKGSAFTAEHAKLIKRVATKVLLSLDADSAGVEATKRSIPIVQAVGLELRVIKLGKLGAVDKKDPDDIARGDPKTWRQRVKNSVSAFQFLIEAALSQHDSTSPEGKRAIINELAPALSELTHEVEKDFYFKELAQALGVKPRVIAQDIQQQALRTKSQLKVRKSLPKPNKTQPLTRRQKVEKYLWFLLLHSPDQKVLNLAHKLVEVQSTDKILHQLLVRLLDFKATYSLEAFARSLPSDLQQVLFELQLQPQYLSTVEKLNLSQEWHKAFVEFNFLAAQAEITHITQELNQLDRKLKKTPAEEEKQTALLEKIVILKSKIKEL